MVQNVNLIISTLDVNLTQCVRTLTDFYFCFLDNLSDMTSAVDWALKANDLSSIYLPVTARS